MLDSKRDTDVKNRLDSVGEGEGGMTWDNSIETVYYHVYYHMWNRCPVQVQCIKQDTQSQCIGTTQKGDGGGRGVQDGGGTFMPMADSCQCMAKTTTVLYSNQLQIKVNKLI